jgi:hypothetical protein
LGLADRELLDALVEVQILDEAENETCRVVQFRNNNLYVLFAVAFEDFKGAKGF